MPTYDYRCEKCGHEFEKMQSITAKSLVKCDECGKDSLKRLIGAGAGIIFKGSGFYQTDYRSESYKSGEKSEKDKAAKTKEKKAETKAESKETKGGEKSKAKSKSKKKKG